MPGASYGNFSTAFEVVTDRYALETKVKQEIIHEINFFGAQIMPFFIFNGKYFHFYSHMIQ